MKIWSKLQIQFSENECARSVGYTFRGFTDTVKAVYEYQFTFSVLLNIGAPIHDKNT